MTYEEKMRYLASVKPEVKDILLARILKGETVDITKDEDLFFQVNKDRVTLEQFTNRDKYRQEAANVKTQREGMFDVQFGKSKSKKLRWLGDIPAEVYFSRKEFSPSLDKKEREENIRKFFNQFPSFRAGEKRV